MNLTVKQQSQKVLIMNVINKMESRGMEGYYFDSAESAADYVQNLMSPGSTVAFGGSETLKETGILNILKNGLYTVYDRADAHTPQEARQMYANHT